MYENKLEFPMGGGGGVAKQETGLLWQEYGYTIHTISYLVFYYYLILIVFNTSKDDGECS